MQYDLRRFLLLFCFIGGFQICYGQNESNPDMIVSGHGWYGVDMEKSRPNLASYGYMTYEASVGFQTNPKDSCAYAYTFGYPMLSVGFSLARTPHFEFNDQTRFPNLYSIYGSFERSLMRAKHFSMGYQLDFGVTYNPGRYDPINNPGNNWLSSPFMAYFGAGVFAKYHITPRWEIGADVMFRHFSNGRLDLPNEALNALGCGVFVRYRLSDYNPDKYKAVQKPQQEFRKGMQYAIVLGGGVHTCMAEWNAYVEQTDDPNEKKEAASRLKQHPKLSLSFDAMYRYSLRYATGLGVDLFYSSNMEELEQSDRAFYRDDLVDKSPGYAPLSVGIAVVQEVYWKNLAVHVAVGAYPYRHKGVNGSAAKEAGDRERGWHYEKAGLRYYFPKLGVLLQFS